MAKKQIEIIEKIEADAIASAEARKIKPKALSSKRSAFLNKEISYTEQECRSGLGETIEVPESSAGSSHHVWRVCKVWQCGGYTPGLPGTPQSWSNANVITCISMGGTGPSWSNGNTYSPIPPAQWGDDFYDHVSTLVGGINVGDQIEIDISHAQPTVTSGSQAGNTPGSAVCLSGVFPSAAFPNAPNGTANKFCFEYLGTASLARVGQPVSIGNYTWYGYGTMILGYENTVFTALNNNCCFNTCYDIGDTGPEGGTIFAVPLGHPQNNGVNQTNFYYEVAKNDIAIGGTPNAGFNSTCGSPLVSTQTPVMVSAGILNPGNLSFSLTFGPNNLQWIAGVQVPWNQSFNYIDYTGWEVSGVDDNGNQLWAPGTTITSSSYPQLIPPSGGSYVFVGNASTPSLGTLTTSLSSTIKLTPPTIITPWSMTGAEWGVHNKPNIATSTDFGTGHINTDAIDAYPLSPGNPTGGIHPWLDTHDIAATLCKQHGFTNDWFLPSRDEFTEMFTNVGPQLGLSPLGQNSEHMYWTSSHKFLQDPIWPLQYPDKYAWIVKSNGVPGLAYRCHTFSVRPIRRFECEPEPPDPVDTGIDYDYRLNVQSHGTTGGLSFIGQNQPTHYRAEVDTKAYSFEMPLSSATGILRMTGYQGWPPSATWPNGIGPGVVIVDVPTASMVTPITVGQILNSPYGYLGPVMDIVIFGLNSWIIFGNYLGGSSVSTSQPLMSSITIEWGGGDTAFLIDSNALNAVPYNFSGTMPANYNAMPNLTTQLAFQNNISYGQFGTIDQIIDIASDPIHAPNLATYQAQTGASVDTIIKFTPPYGNTYFNVTPVWPFPGPNGSWTYANYPQFSFVDNIKWITPQNIPNPNWNPSPFFSNGIPTGMGGYEIGHPTIAINAASFDVRGNDIRNMLHSAGSLSGSNGYHHVIFNIKIYDQFEKLVCDYDYKIQNANNYAPYGNGNPEPFDYPGCGLGACSWWFGASLVNVNYVDNSLLNAINDIVDVYPYFGQNSNFGRQGNGYLSLTLKTPSNSLPWSSNMTRGNTLNLQNWLGLGDHRITDPNSPPVEYNTTWERFGWGVVCRPCGSTSSNGRNATGCSAFMIREWLAEVPYGPNVVNCNNINNINFNMYYPGYANTGSTSGNGQGWVDAANVGCPGTSGGPRLKTINTSAKKAQNYPDEYKVCYDNQESDFPLSDFGIYFNLPQHKEFIEEEGTVTIMPQTSENASKRQKFINDKKPKETGPFGISGYYPLYDTIEAATYNSPTPIESRSGEKTYGYHIHDFGGQEYYMPNGLEMGITQFHGDYDGQVIPETTARPETIQPEEQVIQPEQQRIILPDEPEETPPPVVIPEPEETYIPPPTPPPPSTSSGGGGSSGGY